MIKYLPAALRDDRIDQIALALFKEEFTVDRAINVHQLDGMSELPLPYAIDIDDPGVGIGRHDLSGEDILRAIEAGRRRNRLARARERGARAATAQQSQQSDEFRQSASDACTDHEDELAP